jgi:DNA-3-methyladenine glycosylase
VKRQPDGEPLWGVIVETAAYSQEEPARHGYRRPSPSKETLFGEPRRLYVYVSDGIHHCVNVVIFSTLMLEQGNYSFGSLVLEMFLAL